MPTRVRSVTVGYYIAITLLVIGLAIGVALLTRIARPAGNAITVGQAMAVACESGDRAPGCFGFTVRNTSSSVSSVQCLVVPAERTIARFTTDQSTVVLTLQPGEERTLRTSVDPVDGDVVAAPAVECGSLP